MDIPSPLFRMALVVAALLASACVSAARPEGTDGATQSARVIVKLRDVEPLNETYTDFEREARRSGATIKYVRALRGNVHLYEIAGADTETVAHLLRRLSAHPNVEYVEPDRIMRHQSPRGETR